MKDFFIFLSFLPTLETSLVSVTFISFFACFFCRKAQAAALEEASGVDMQVLAVPSPILVIDADSLTLLKANAAFTQLYGEYPEGTSLNDMMFTGGSITSFIKEILVSLPVPQDRTDKAQYLSLEKKTALLLWKNHQAYAQTPVKVEVFSCASFNKKTIVYLSVSPAQAASAHCSRAYYNSIATHAFLYLDAKGRVISCNRVFEQLAKLNFHSMFGQQIHDITLPEDLRSRLIEDVTTVFLRGTHTVTDISLIQDNGEEALYSCHTHPDISPANDVQGVHIVWRNTMHRSTAMQILKRQEKLLLAAIDAALYLFSDSLDIDTIVPQVLETLGKATHTHYIDIWRNHQSDQGLMATQLFRWSASSLLPQNFSSTLSYETELYGWEEILNNGDCINSLYENFPIPDKLLLESQNITSMLIVPISFQNTFWGFIRIGERNSHRHWSTGEEAILHSIGIFLTSAMQQKHVQSALVQSERRFQDVSNATGEIIWEVNAHGYISYVSPRVVSVLGYTQEELINTRFEDYTEATDQDSITGVMFQLSVSQSSFQGLEHQFRAKNGKICWLLSSGLLLAGDEGLEGLRGTSLDITQQKCDAERLRQTMLQLQDANAGLQRAIRQEKSLVKKAELATKAKDDFIANMSHELRTPLNAIIGMAYLASKTEMNPKQADYIKKISSAGISLLSIVNDVLDFSKAEAGAIILNNAPFTFESILGNLAAVTGIRADGQRLNMAICIDNDVPNDLIGDAIRFEQVLANIVGNSIKFSEKGSIAIRCSLVSKEADRVTLKLVIRDSGVGMSKSQLSGLFNAFKQADNSLTRRFGGTGLGLVLAKSLLNLADGTIEVTSELHQGTTVTITIPFFLMPQSHHDQGQWLPHVNPFSAVLIEKKGFYRDTLVAMLEKMGGDVTVFDDITHALLHIEKKDVTGEPCQIAIFPFSFLEERNKANLTHFFETMTLLHPPAVLVIVPFSYDDHVTDHKEYTITPVYTPVSSQSLGEAIQRAQDLFTVQATTQYFKSLPYFPNAKILLVEDNPINQQLVVELLREVGIHTTIAETGKKALEILATVTPNAFDLIFMDLQMPEIDGYATTRKIRKKPHYKNLPIIAMTAHATPEEKERCFAAGMNDHLSKPLDILKLHTLLKQWLTPISEKKLSERSTVKEFDTSQKSEQIDYHALYERLQYLIFLLQDDDAQACTVFNEIEPSLKLFDSKATLEASYALAVFDFLTALSFLEPMEHGLHLFLNQQPDVKKE